MYANKTEHVILKDMLDKVTSPVNKDEGTLIYDALSPAANEFAKQYMELDSIQKRVFAQTSYGEYLEMRAAEFGVSRRDGNKAAVELTFTGVANTNIPAGFIVQTKTGLLFRTIKAVTIVGTTAKVMAEADAIGTMYNVTAGTIIQIPTSLTGISSVINESSATGGTAIETDDQLIERLLFKVKYPATSGNRNHYKSWAMEVEGVGDAKVFAIWDGPGTVKVTIIDIHKQPANSEIVAAVTQHIEDSRPIGATVTVNSATALTVNISATIQRVQGASLDEIRAKANAEIDKYLKQIAFKHSYVSLAQIGSIILNIEGVSDYASLQLNGSSSNIAIGDEEVAVLGTVNING